MRNQEQEQNDAKSYRKQVELLTVERNNLQLVLKGLADKQLTNIRLNKNYDLRLNSKPDLCKGQKFRNCQTTAKLSQSNLIDNLKRSITSQDDVTQDESVKTPNFANHPLIRSKTPPIFTNDLNPNLIQCKSSQFLEIDILHQTTRLIQRQDNSKVITSIFTKHFVNANNLIVMIKSQVLDHALVKLLAFTNEILNLVLRLESKEKEISTKQSSRQVPKLKTETIEIKDFQKKSGLKTLMKYLDRDPEQAHTPSTKKITFMEPIATNQTELYDTFFKSKTQRSQYIKVVPVEKPKEYLDYQSRKTSQTVLAIFLIFQIIRALIIKSFQWGQ